MAVKGKELSHEEVWDDSALLASWDEALEEYKLYHSIHAKGERVEDVIADFQRNGDPQLNGDNDEFATTPIDDDMEDGEWNEPEHAGDPTVPCSDTNHADGDTVPDPVGVPPNSLPFPEQLASQGNDDSLKQLIMSWYWAGYYTGFYQGQNKQQADQNGQG